ncbi:hypothetical protein ACP4OV_022118 [Aristida adscensionis]
MARSPSPSPRPPRPPPPAWSVAVRLRHRGGLEIRASAENVLPGWGRGGERLSLLLRLRRRLILAVTSRCGPRAPPPGQPATPPRGCGKLLRFLRSTWPPLPRLPSIWRRKKPPVRAAGQQFRKNRASTPTIQCCRAWTPTLRFAAAAMAALAVAASSIAVFRLTVDWAPGRMPRADSALRIMEMLLGEEVHGVLGAAFPEQVQVVAPASEARLQVAPEQVEICWVS